MTFGDMLSQSNSESVLQPQEELKIVRVLIDGVADAVFCLGQNAEFLYVNDATCQMTEYSREELLSMTLSDIDVDFLLQNWSQKWLTLKSQGNLTFKSRYQTKSGRMFLLKVKITYVEHEGRELGCAFARDNSNEVVELSVQQYTDKSEELQEGLRQEVSEYKKTETELETSLSLVRSTLDSTANGIIAVNFEGEFLYYNQKFLEMWELPNSVNISKKCNRAKVFFESKVKNSELFRSRVWEMSSQIDGESYDLVELKDGRIFAHHSQPQRLDDKIIGRVWSIWDVTESKRTEEALRLNESRFRTLAETTDASIFLIQNNRLCYANPAAEILTGYTRKELFNNFGLDRLFKSKKLRQVDKQDGTAGFEYQEMQIITKNGNQRWLACTVGILDAVLDFANNQPVELITAIDITDYKHAESEVRQALEQAKRLSELRERFVSMLCHQFRTPLNIVSFSADLLRRHIHNWSEDKNRSYLDLIQAAVKQISNLLDDILLFGKAEAAKLECQPRPLDLEQFCRDIVAQMQMASDNQKVINFFCQGNCTTAYLDPKLLQHILTNLISNAIKYSPAASTVSMEVCCRGKEVIFQVKDAGIGIAVVDQQQIFEPFYRGSNVDNIPGTGLGLSIVKTLVELHHGEIAVKSEVGLGTTFIVTLPSVK